MSEHSQAIHIANRWLDFKMNALTQMVPGDPDCDACVLARQYIRTEDSLRVFMASNAALTAELANFRTLLSAMKEAAYEQPIGAWFGAINAAIAKAANGTTTESAL